MCCVVGVCVCRNSLSSLDPEPSPFGDCKPELVVQNLVGGVRWKIHPVEASVTPGQGNGEERKVKSDLDKGGGARCPPPPPHFE